MGRHQFEAVLSREKASLAGGDEDAKQGLREVPEVGLAVVDTLRKGGAI